MSVWHRLNNLLQVLLVNLKLLDARVRDPEGRELLGEAREAAQRIADVIKRLSENGDYDMSDIKTQELATLKRRASDQSKTLRTAGGWAGILMGVAAFGVGLARANDTMVISGFVAAMVASNVLPFESVRGLIPWGKKE